MDAPEDTQVKIIPIDLPGDQFQVYNRISRNYKYSFLFETLENPNAKKAISVMGF